LFRTLHIINNITSFFKMFHHALLILMLSTYGLAVVVASSPVATRLTFDYGWRFQASATDAPTLPPTLPPTPAECHNLTKVFPIKTAAHKTYSGLIANRGATNAAELEAASQKQSTYFSVLCSCPFQHSTINASLTPNILA
jgi:hypothetical protein